jgi:hypothetical protein
MNNCIIYDNYIKNKKVYIINNIYNNENNYFFNDYHNFINFFKNYDIIAYKKELKIKNENEIKYEFNDTCEVIYDLKDNINRFLQIGFVNNYIIIKNLNKYNINIKISYMCYFLMVVVG